MYCLQFFYISSVDKTYGHLHGIHISEEIAQVNYLIWICSVYFIVYSTPAAKTIRILGECILISSLPGKSLRTLVEIARLAERFNKRSQS